MTSIKGLGEIDSEVAAKVAKVEEDRVARLPVGKNVVELDGKSCTHEVAWPPGQTGSLLPPPKREGPPAREYPFKIDPFQQTAVNALEAGVPMHDCACYMHGLSMAAYMCCVAGTVHAACKHGWHMQPQWVGMYLHLHRCHINALQSCRPLSAGGSAHLSWQDRGG